MTSTEATTATAFITHPALREMAIAALMSGKTTICPDCGNIASAETGCFPCDEAKFASQCAEHDALMMNAETYDPFEATERAIEAAMTRHGRLTGGSRHSEL